MTFIKLEDIMSIVEKLNQAEFHFVTDSEPYSINDFVPDLLPSLISDDGVIVEIIEDASNLDEVFEKVGKIIALQKFIEIEGLKHKYTVILALDIEQYKKLHRELRKSLYKQTSVVVLN